MQKESKYFNDTKNTISTTHKTNLTVVLDCLLFSDQQRKTNCFALWNEQKAITTHAFLGHQAFFTCKQWGHQLTDK